MSRIIVIGGGIAGLSAAARLSADAEVTLLERESALGYHASGRSAALFEENYGSPSTIALNHLSAPYHHEANGGYLSPRGLMLVAHSHQEDLFRADVVAMGTPEISPAEARGLVPILNEAELAFAAYHTAAYDIDTDRMLQDFARTLTGNGGTLVTGAEVTGIDPGSIGWEVSTTKGHFKAERIVNAGGAWADGLAKMAGIAPLGLVPHRRSMARLAAPGGEDTRAWPMFFGVGETWYAKPDAGALLVSPAEADPVDPQDAWPDDMVLAEGLARYQDMVVPEVTRPIATWAGLRTFAPDGALVLGPDPDEPSFIWCAGQGGYGFQCAPAASQLLADLVLGRDPAAPPDIVAQLTPQRLRG
ncbi:MAG: FAD-binding oxidoreductase [Sulfitobacter sp.]|nr:FAD-binding oxidoreductase [Sulfitobacter sp.]